MSIENFVYHYRNMTGNSEGTKIDKDGIRTKDNNVANAQTLMALFLAGNENSTATMDKLKNNKDNSAFNQLAQDFDLDGDGNITEAELLKFAEFYEKDAKEANKNVRTKASTVKVDDQDKTLLEQLLTKIKGDKETVSQEEFSTAMQTLIGTDGVLSKKEVLEFVKPSPSQPEAEPKPQSDSPATTPVSDKTPTQGGSQIIQAQIHESPKMVKPTTQPAAPSNQPNYIKLPSGVQYAFDDKGKLSLEANISALSENAKEKEFYQDTQNLVKDFISDKRQLANKMYTFGGATPHFTASTARNFAIQEAQNLSMQHQIYNHLKQKQDVTDAESGFIKFYEKSLKKYNLEIDDKGKLVRSKVLTSIEEKPQDVAPSHKFKFENSVETKKKQPSSVTIGDSVYKLSYNLFGKLNSISIEVDGKITKLKGNELKIKQQEINKLLKSL